MKAKEKDQILLAIKNDNFDYKKAIHGEIIFCFSFSVLENPPSFKKASPLSVMSKKLPSFVRVISTKAKEKDQILLAIKNDNFDYKKAIHGEIISELERSDEAELNYPHL